VRRPFVGQERVGSGAAILAIHLPRDPQAQSENDLPILTGMPRSKTDSDLSYPLCLSRWSIMALISTATAVSSVDSLTLAVIVA